MEPEKESRIDSCVECCVRDRDFSQKQVYRCELCKRWFCEKHLQPKLAFIRDPKRVERSPEIERLQYTEMHREDGHPDFEYSRRKFTELDIAEEERLELITRAFNGMNSHYKRKYLELFYICPKCGSQYHVFEEMKYCTKCGSSVKGLPYDVAKSSSLRNELTKEPKNIVEEVSPEATATETKKDMISEGKFHFEKREEDRTPVKYSEKSKKRRHFPVGKIIGILLIILVIGAALAYFAPTILSYMASSTNSSNSSNSSSSNGLGTEIMHYPLDTLSFAVTSWSYATTLYNVPDAGLSSALPSGSIYVVVNFTFRNIGDTETNLESDYWSLQPVTVPLLQYGNYYATSPTFFSFLSIYSNQPTDLMPNQTTNGALIYTILQGYTPSRLLYPNKDSPTFVINLSG
jgi:ribosomal protein L37AE/L43A